MMTTIEVWPKFIHAGLFVHGLLAIWYDGIPQYGVYDGTPQCGVYNIGINTGYVHLTTTKTFYHINITP